MRSHESTAHIMADVLIALAPALVVAVGYFGWRALALTATCVVSALLAEYISRRVMKRHNTLGDLSAAVTGVILAFNLPATFPLWMAAVGSVFAIVVVKQMFGGVGQNFVNPALTARIGLMVSFPPAMAAYTAPRFGDAGTTATPMAILSGAEGKLPSLTEMLLGLHGGSMGEICSAALLLGGLYLMVRRVITPTVPLTYLGTVAVCMLLYGHGNLTFVAYELLGGGLLLGAFFMATDYTTSPLTETGRAVFGVGCGLLTSLIRLYGSLPEGVSFSILLMNIFVPYIERLTVPRAFGSEKKGGRAA